MNETCSGVCCPLTSTGTVSWAADVDLHFGPAVGYWHGHAPFHFHDARIGRGEFGDAGQILHDLAGIETAHDQVHFAARRFQFELRGLNFNAQRLADDDRLELHVAARRTFRPPIVRRQEAGQPSGQAQQANLQLFRVMRR